MRLIDADALCKDIDYKITEYGFETEKGYAMHIARKIVENEPTVKAEPVRHGRWIEESANEYYCSYCGKYAPIAKNMRHCDCSKWCKECGTKMDGGANDGNG